MPRNLEGYPANFLAKLKLKIGAVGLRWPALACVGLRWPVLAFVGLRWPSLAFVDLRWPSLALVGCCVTKMKYKITYSVKKIMYLVWPKQHVWRCLGPFSSSLAFVGRHWLLWAFVGLRWPLLAAVGLHGPVLAFVDLRWPLLALVG